MICGAHYLGNSSCRFTVWAPFRDRMEVKILNGEHERIVPLHPIGQGYWQKDIADVPPKSQYLYRLDNDLERPDPASHSQPQGVHGPSRVIDHSAFAWADHGWSNIPQSELILYELHIGTFTPEGTCRAVIPRLSELKDLGITAVSLMPVAQCPGERNWGYDGVYPFAVSQAYGGVQGLKELVNACHREGLAVILDVVYNHLGPEGNYLRDFGPYFTPKYTTPWGEAINFDQAYCEPVRRFFLDNALYWVEDFHMDGLRLDAIQAIMDQSSHPFLQELSLEMEAMGQSRGKPVYIIAESDLNDARVLRPRSQDGFGHQAQWTDDFHHSLHAVLTGERQGYYQDFGGLQDVQKSVQNGYVYTWQYSPFRQRRHGTSSAECRGEQFVVYTQTHDQVGNRMLGERLSHLVGFEALKLVAGCMFCSPFVPMLFMGQEYAETAPFLYFVHHSDPDLVEAVRRGRAEEFKDFQWSGTPPDPQDKKTFTRSRLNWDLRSTGRHAKILALYQELIGLRRSLPPLRVLDKDRVQAETWNNNTILTIHRWYRGQEALLMANFSPQKQSWAARPHQRPWSLLLDSSQKRWAGPGGQAPQRLNQAAQITLMPWSFVLYTGSESEKEI
ncbi:MAG: malto-oligosyltrehalose trehalohydrolase [Desulfovermiculus sp.]